MARKTLRVVTRRSDLALLQTSLIINPLLGGSRLSNDISIEIVPNDTFGDAGKYQEALRASRDAGQADNKRKWIHELEVALLAGEVDVAIHSGKDYPAEIIPGTTIIPILDREDARDCFISKERGRLKDLPAGAIVGTASKRRAAQVLHIRPDLKVKEYTGNVVTRISLKTMIERGVDGIIVAYAGIVRLGEIVPTAIRPQIQVLEIDEMMPAVNQGILLGQCRSDDSFARDILMSLRREQTATIWAAERAVIETMGADCKSAVSVYADYESPSVLSVKVAVYEDDGTIKGAAARRGSPAEARQLGAALGNDMLKFMP